MSAVEPRTMRGGDEQAGLAVADEVAVAVPVGGDDRQAAGHRLDDDQAEGLLDAVGERRDHVGGVPDRESRGGVHAVDEDGADARGEPAVPRRRRRRRTVGFAAQPERIRWTRRPVERAASASPRYIGYGWALA